MKKLNEDTLTEQPVIEWFKEMGYDHEKGPDIAPGQITGEREDFREVVLVGRLKRYIRRLNPDLPEAAIDDVARSLKSEHPNLEIANKEIYTMLTQGVRVNFRGADEEDIWRFAKIVDFDNPQNNEFLVINQFAIQGSEKVRRPDVVVFVNGIPLAIFELKNPALENATIYTAYEQLREYKKDIPEIFKYNQVLVVGDLIEARHGTISSSWEWFSHWKGIESEDEQNHGISELETLARGIFHKIRFLDIVRNFIIFEADAEKDASKFTKKMAMYHQYFGVNKAVNETLRAAKPRGNKKIGVFWHTQGSGKSLSMVFYTNKAKRLEELKSPTFVFLTDRNDLDGQFYKTFLRSGYPSAKQAESVTGLKERLREAAGELIFTTIQKFDTEYEVLSERENIIVIADEAHRSQYAKFAGNVRVALPNASFMGITGTPISLQNRETRLVFGNHISEYKINQAVEDGATVPIYYEGRLVPLHLANQFIDEEFEDLTGEIEFEAKEVYKRKWARLEQAVSAKDRLEQVAKDIVSHFNNRGLEGKGMIVTISRKTAVEMYKIISKLLSAPAYADLRFADGSIKARASAGKPEVAVVISKPEDFPELHQSRDTKELEKRFKNPDDSLKLVIVCDMWLTGFDVPSLHTMYIDKPLKNHTLMQAIARVNRIFKDKPGGLIVDYIGIADDLKKALSIYSSGIQKEAMIPIEEIIAKMMEKYDIVRAMFAGVEYKEWKKLKGSDLAQLFQKAVNTIITNERSGMVDDEQKKRFAKETELLSQLFAFAMPHKEANAIRNEVEFFQAVKRAVIKRIIIQPEGIGFDIESAVRELVSKAISAEGVIDIFDMKGKGRPDISIFDEKFLEEVKNLKYKNLSVDVLRKLLNDELRVRMRKNLVRYKSLLDMLEDIIEKYENNIINSTKVIEKLIELAKEIRKVEKQGEGIGLSEEEMAFYDAISVGRKAINGNGKFKELVRELVKIIKRDLAIDWMNNDIIKARIRANVKLLLLRKGYKAEESEKVLDLIYQQAFSLYRDFVPAMA
ncbi:type I restriction endonuclease subunit R [Candidatus Wolfebacteria bacterium]|nr:type I restriction endonuclease subunit R [Candidatus Wolfebacteria bacterium]